MTADFQQLAASVLNSSASAFAGLAASRLLQRHPDAGQQFGPEALSMWRTHLTARVQELAVAVEFGLPEILNSAIDWSRRSFLARDVSEHHLRASMETLREVLADELPEQARDKTLAVVDDAIRSLEAPAFSGEPLSARGNAEKLAFAYIDACLSGNARRAMRLVLDAADSGMDLHAIYFDVLARAEREMGDMWHAAKVGVHEEHFVTSTTLSLLALLAHRATPEKENGKIVVGAAIGGDGHDLGVRMIMDFFTMAGWNSICLGSSVPGPDLARAAADFKADLMVLSVTLSTNLRFLRGAVSQVREAVPNVKILLGGQAFTDAPDVWREVGADGVAMRADEAVEKAARLVGLETA